MYFHNWLTLCCCLLLLQRSTDTFIVMECYYTRAREIHVLVERLKNTYGWQSPRVLQSIGSQLIYSKNTVTGVHCKCRSKFPIKWYITCFITASCVWRYAPEFLTFTDYTAVEVLKLISERFINCRAVQLIKNQIWILASNEYNSGIIENFNNCFTLFHFANMLWFCIFMLLIFF